MKTRKCSFHMGRITGSDEDISVTITDKGSGVLVAEVGLTLEQFAKAVTGVYISDAVYQHGNLELVGKVREVKTELLPLAHLQASNRYMATAEEIDEFLRPYEVDGWIGYPTDVTNLYNRVGDSVSVSFHRWVDETE